MSPPQANTSATDRSDASGLVEGDPDAWATAPEPPAPAAPAGVPPAPAAVAPAGGANVPLIVPVVLGGVPGNGSARERDRGEREQPVPADAAGGREDEDRDDPAFVPPFLVPPPADRRRREERSDAGELLTEPDATWDRTPVDQDLPPDYVALVRESDDDFSSWDADPLPWVDDRATGPAGEDDPGSWGVPAPEADSGPPAAPAPAEPPPPVRPRPAGQSFEAALLREMPIRAGGPDLTPEEQDELAARRAEQERQERIKLGLEKDEDDEDDEPAERRAADLLDKDDAQWNKRDDGVVGGVIG